MNTWNNEALDRDAVRAAKRRAVIKQAAIEFRRRGYHATSMDDIAAALNVSKAALYRYVKSKDEVLFECFMQSNDIAGQALRRANDTPGSGADKLELFLVEFITDYLDSNVAGGAMIEIDALLPDQRLEVVRGRDRVTLLYCAQARAKRFLISSVCCSEFAAMRSSMNGDVYQTKAGSSEKGVPFRLIARPAPRQQP